MTNNQIDIFIRRHGGVNVNFYVDNISKNFAAYTELIGINKQTNKPIYVIVLERKIFRNKKSPISFLEALLLHELGHIKCNHFHRKLADSTAEYEAQSWAITKAIKLKRFNIVCFLVQIYLSWMNLSKNKKRLKYYYNAYRMFYKKIGKDNINNWKIYFDLHWKFKTERIK